MILPFHAFIIVACILYIMLCDPLYKELLKMIQIVMGRMINESRECAKDTREELDPGADAGNKTGLVIY